MHGGSENQGSGRLTGLLNPILQATWYVHPPVVLILRATPGMCLHTLATAAKPSTQRLHLRNLFANGRRYRLQAQMDGFMLTTTSQIIWRYRRRTASSAVLLARFFEVDGEITRVQMQIRLRLFYLLDVFLIPTFMASILIFMPWPPAVIIGLLLTLYLLSWFGHRFNAALEANEMVFFVQKALEDFVPAEIFSLSPEASPVINLEQGFSEAWDKFYEEHQAQ